MHLILTGATGLCGSAVLDAMIRTKELSRITILSRRPVQMATDSKDPRINVIIHENFEEYDQSLIEQLKGATGCVWALGISQTQVGKQEYVKITKSFVLEAAKAFQTIQTEDETPFNFVYVSGQGATLTPGMLTPIFGRVKGETELALAELRKSNPQFHAMSIRPAVIDAGNHDAIMGYLPKRGAFVSAATVALGLLAKTAMPSSWSPTIPLGQFMVELAMGKRKNDMMGKHIEKLGDFMIIENTNFRKATQLD